MLERLLTPEEVAERLRHTRAWVLAHANGSRSPKLPSVKIGKSRRFRPQDIEQWIQQHTVAA